MNEKITHSFRTQALLFTGLIGFLLGVFLLFNPGNEYHDFVFHPRNIADTLMAHKQRELFPTAPSPDSILLARSILRKIQRFDDLDTVVPRDFDRPEKPRPPEAVRQRISAYLLYIRIQQERRRLEDQADTSLNSRLLVGSLFTSSKATLAGIYSNPDTSAAARTFIFRYDRDTTAPEYSIHAEGPITLRSKTYPATGLTFFARYPGFGTFALLMIFQFVLFFIVIPLAFMTIIQMRKDHAAKPATVWKVFIIAFVVVMAFALMIYLYIVTPSYIGDTFFMKGFASNVWTYYILAYGSGIVCYAGYLFAGRLIADLMHSIKNVAITQRNNILQRNAVTSVARSLAGTTPEAATALTASIASTTNAIADTGKTIAAYADTYRRLRSQFTLFFYTSAFLLTMIVLETGSLFSAISSLDLMKFLEAPPSYSLLRNDFVYLLGGLYSILLLIFYVPVKITMINLESQLPDTKVAGAGGSGAGTGTGDQNWLPVFSSGLRTTAAVLAASSPFLISIIQFVLQSVFGGK
ncbi:MAG TPA: hypothetical protein VMH27_04995 [Puia sp.]|nr:hypothetical protein [Puia sp.]